MSAHVVVIDASLRRATVKTTPNKHLSDILEEACGKLGLKASNYGLKNNNKQVDLSRSFRLSGLISGAKLELVQLSKSAGVVSVALQLLQDAAGIPNGRLTDKFPSSTTLWQILRKFEDGVAGGQMSQTNLTRRGAPSTGAGEGRLFYQQPVLQVMNRELSTLTDLNKNLAQLGLNSGSALIRLSFRTSEIPLEEALVQIQQYFASVDQENQTPTAQDTPNNLNEKSAQPAEQEQPEWTADEGSQSQSVPAKHGSQSPEADLESTNPSSDHTASLTSRPLSVYRPPSSSTPSAAMTTHNDADYVPTIEHAQTHQRMLNESSRNRRLATDAELAAQAQAEAEKLAAIREVEIRVRFPDQNMVQATFRPEDTGTSLYSFVRECLDPRFVSEAFTLRDPSTRVRGDLVSIPENDKRLIQQLGLKGRVLLVFGWDDEASVEARGAHSALKAELRAKAVDVKVNDVVGPKDDGDRGVNVNIGKEEKSQDGGGGMAKKMPKWLKGLAKK